MLVIPFATEIYVGKAAAIAAKSHGLILEIAFTTLVADWAIQGVINQEKFHDTFASFTS